MNLCVAYFAFYSYKTLGEQFCNLYI